MVGWSGHKNDNWDAQIVLRGLKMESINKQFKLKFNELDQLCKLMYPKYPNGFDAIRQFAYSLEGDNKNTLLNLIKARNMNTHDNKDIISFNKQAVDFLQGLIDGVNRKIHNGSKVKIDSDIENLRTRNLKKMSSMINSVMSKYSFLSKDVILEIKGELNNYINHERTAIGLENVKKYYFEFLDAIKLIESRTEVRTARRKNKENNLGKAKSRALNEIERMYAEVINETSIFNIVTRNRAKNLKQSAISSINRCFSFEQIDDVLEDYEFEFEDIMEI